VEYTYNSTLSLTSALDGSEWSTPRAGSVTPGKEWVSVVQEAGSDRLRELSPPPGFDPRTVHSVASLYPDPQVQLLYPLSAVGYIQSSTVIVNRIPFPFHIMHYNGSLSLGHDEAENQIKWADFRCEPKSITVGKNILVCDIPM
jgi:hypothetical protein